MARILKWWHQYGFLASIVGYLFLLIVTWTRQEDAVAKNSADIASMQAQNLDHRITVLEQIASDNRDNFSEIKDTEKAIFQRINQIVDSQHGH